jgi:hypothetical protein
VRRRKREKNEAKSPGRCDFPIRVRLNSLARRIPQISIIHCLRKGPKKQPPPPRSAAVLRARQLWCWRIPCRSVLVIVCASCAHTARRLCCAHLDGISPRRRAQFATRERRSIGINIQILPQCQVFGSLRVICEHILSSDCESREPYICPSYPFDAEWIFHNGILNKRAVFSAAFNCITLAHELQNYISQV